MGFFDLAKIGFGPLMPSLTLRQVRRRGQFLHCAG
jgi:hypothetical protein